MRGQTFFPPKKSVKPFDSAQDRSAKSFDSFGKAQDRSFDLTPFDVVRLLRFHSGQVCSPQALRAGRTGLWLKDTKYPHLFNCFCEKIK